MVWMARVFVSHSSQDEVFTREFVEKLGTPPIEVLVDYDDLRAGRWNPQLNEWMAACHAAVLLLSGHALKSDWVRNESTMLVWRACTEDDFVLVPVRLGSPWSCSPVSRKPSDS